MLGHQLREALHEKNIDARVFFHPLSSLPTFPDSAETGVSHDIAARALNLPSYHDMSEEALGRVVEVVKAVV